MEDVYTDARSDEVQELLTYRPHWVIRRGIWVTSFSVVSLVLSTSIIEYPDIVRARIVMTTQSPPIGVVARSSGRVSHLLVKAGQQVEVGDSLAIIENPAVYKEVHSLKADLAHFSPYLQNLASQPRITLGNYESLGDLQASYSSFLQSYLSFQYFMQTNIAARRIAALRDQIKENQVSEEVLSNRVETLRQKMRLVESGYDKNKTLYSQGLISENDLASIETSYLDVKNALQSLEGDKAMRKMQRADLERELLDAEDQQEQSSRERRVSLSESYKQLRNQISTWEDRYLLKSPIKGIVTFYKVWSDNQYVQSGEVVFTVVPFERHIIGKLMLPSVGSGKVRVGQRVNIKLDGYSYYEFGMIEGRVEAISPMPRENSYLVDVSLPKGLVTSYGKAIPPQPEFQGTADVVTQDVRLIWRLMRPLRYLLSQAA